MRLQIPCIVSGFSKKVTYGLNTSMQTKIQMLNTCGGNKPHYISNLASFTYSKVIPNLFNFIAYVKKKGKL